MLPPTATTKWSVVELLAAAPQQRDVNLDLFDKTLPPLSEKDDYSASSGMDIFILVFNELPTTICITCRIGLLVIVN